MPVVKASKNFFAFIWHAFFLALAETFSERNTVLPGLILLAGGTSSDVGILSAISIGVPLVSQLLFAGFLTPKPHKKPFLLIGIGLRVSAFFLIAFSFQSIYAINPTYLIYLVFIGIFIFSISGAFAGISYNDIVGKSFVDEERKRFFVAKQLVASIGILISAVLVRSLLVEFAYPDNYQIAFGVAGSLLFIASMGFLFIKEKPTKLTKSYSGFIEVIKSIPHEVRSNNNLKYFIITSNLLGLSFTLLPFYIAYAKSSFALNDELIGNYLLVQIIGMIISNYIWKKALSKYAFKGMLKITIILFALIPIYAVIIVQFSISLYLLVFVFTGFAVGAYKISFDGVLLEISNEGNRALYSGIIGTFNLTMALFPLVIGYLVSVINYGLLLPILGLSSLSGLIFLNLMDCPGDKQTSK